MAQTLSTSTPARPQTSANLVPPAPTLKHFDLVDNEGTLRSRPCAVRCPMCAQRENSDGGGLLCILLTDGSGRRVLCYYHSKGKFKNDTPRGRWIVSAMPRGTQSRIICDYGHVCDIPV